MNLLQHKNKEVLAGVTIPSVVIPIKKDVQDDDSEDEQAESADNVQKDITLVDVTIPNWI